MATEFFSLAESFSGDHQTQTFMEYVKGDIERETDPPENALAF